MDPDTISIPHNHILKEKGETPKSVSIPCCDMKE